MVTHLVFIFSLLPLLLFSGTFTASVSHNQVNPGESFTLNLTLKDSSAKGSPTIDSLKSSFIINSQQQVYSSSILNRQVTSSTTWTYLLIPKEEGRITIPSLHIDTDQGTLSTQPLEIQVVKGAASVDSDLLGITLATEVSNAKPYKNEPIFYTVKLSSKRNLANIKMEKIQIEDAVIEVNGEPKIYEQVIDGVNVGVAEFSYLITPLKAGFLKIPSAVIQGGIPTRRKTHINSFFSDHFDPFAMMQGFDQLKPFALETEETLLNVQPASLSPWLPAQSLRIEETWIEPQSFTTGEPFTRSFKIVGEGIRSSQLPSLSELLVNDHSFKIYADKPEFGDEVRDGQIKSYRKEHYTIIPQQPGTFTLSEISVPWWNVMQKEKAFAHVPSRILQILPAAESIQPKPTSSHDPSTATQPKPTERDPILYALIAALTFLLLGAVFWGISLQKKIGRLSQMPVSREKFEKEPVSPIPDKTPVKQKKNKNEQLPDLNPT